jgi:glycerophosphoryl diester phosphodiesterase|tara:strand:- start:875 stop:1765 length:891 start_codon:yes stop_codon:yes gene_type:complete
MNLSLVRQLTFSALVTVLVVYVILLLWPAKNRVADIPFYADNAFAVIAHGNGRALMPGNTLEAAVNALSVGADILELDIHLTADNILVVRHDETIDSTTNGTGRIAEMTLAELSLYDVGFHEYDYPDKYAEKGIRIPTLESFFVALPANRFLIELKPKDGEAGRHLCQLVKEYGLLNQVIVGSFHSSVLRLFRQQCPEIPTSLGEEEVLKMVVLNWFGLGHHYDSPGYSVQLPLEQYGIRVFSKSLLETARELNLKLDVWTVNNVQEMADLIKIGVDGIITDRPDLLDRVESRVIR